MKTSHFALLVAMLTLSLLAACGGQETAAPVVEEIDLTTLADSVDVDTVHAIKDNPGVFLLDVREPCLLYTSPSPRDGLLSRMPSSA